MKEYRISRITEADYGCEECPADGPHADVYFFNEKGGETRIELSEQKIAALSLSEGSLFARSGNGEISVIDHGIGQRKKGHPLYFVRHGQTIWNVENKICGATDVPLTDEGRRQAEMTGQRLKMLAEQGVFFADEILSSPLSRARDTAEIISEITGIPMRVEPRLVERNFGRFESTPRDGAEFYVAKRQMADSFSGGESTLRVAQRIYNLLDELSVDPKTYLLAAHNGLARVIETYFYDIENEAYAAFSVTNCEVVRYFFR